MTGWRDLLEGVSREERIKACLAFELASDRASGEPVEVVTSTLRAVAQAEGLDPGRAWIAAAAREIARGHPGRTALGGRPVEPVDLTERPPR